MTNIGNAKQIINNIINNISKSLEEHLQNALDVVASWLKM